MNNRIFNISLALAWLLIVVGVSLLVSLPAGLVVGGVVLMVVTLLLARWAGVTSPQQKG